VRDVPPVRRWCRPLVLLLLLPLVTACAGDDEAVDVSGSSTVEPISIAVAERFAEVSPAVQTIVDGPGTGDGFKLFCAGQTDINDASSKIKPAQVEECAENGVEFVELWIGNDGIAVMTNPANDDVDCLTFADLYALTGPEAQGVDRWDEASSLATELGSPTVLPDAPLAITGPGEESGTYVSYVEIVLEGIAEERGIDPVETRPDYQASADDNVTIQAVQGSATALGWVGYAFAAEAEGVALVAVDDGESGCVAPTDDAIADGSYPISRPLFIYVNPAKAEENPALVDFVDFYLSDEGISSVADVGYVALPPDRLEETRARWRHRVTGAVEEEAVGV
jgi:phosphate transport system substrate-binding protein